MISAVIFGSKDCLKARKEWDGVRCVWYKELGRIELRYRLGIFSQVFFIGFLLSCSVVIYYGNITLFHFRYFLLWFSATSIGWMSRKLHWSRTLISRLIDCHIIFSLYLLLFFPHTLIADCFLHPPYDALFWTLPSQFMATGRHHVAATTVAVVGGVVVVGGVLLLLLLLLLSCSLRSLTSLLLFFCC